MARGSIGEPTFQDAIDLSRKNIIEPTEMPIDGIPPSIEDYFVFYGLWLNRYIRKFLLDDGRRTRKTPLEQRLLKVILLHKLMFIFSTQGDRYFQRNCVGVMLQKELTLLLVEIDTSQWTRLFDLKRQYGIDPKEWELHITGASAAANVCLTLMHRPEAVVYLPEGYEDVGCCIDLFWEEMGMLHALSVKAARSINWHVDALIVPRDNARTRDEQNLVLGVARIPYDLPEELVPVLVTIRKPVGTSIPLDQDWTRVRWPDEILESELPTLRTDSLHLRLV